MYLASRSVLLASLAVSQAIAASAANAQTAIPPPFVNYAAKFTCGTGAVDDVLGTYASSINIHNPHATTISFYKKIVVAEREGVLPFQKPVIVQDVLPPDFVQFVDCTVVYTLTKIAAGTKLDGFFVLEVPPTFPFNPAIPALNPPLDVVGKYTVTNAPSTSPTISVVAYAPSYITY
jgi:hypothetical protein